MKLFYGVMVALTKTVTSSCVMDYWPLHKGKTLQFTRNTYHMVTLRWSLIRCIALLRDV